MEYWVNGMVLYGKLLHCGHRFVTDPSLSGGVFGQWDIPLQRHRQSQIQREEVRLRKSPQSGTTIPQSGPATQGNRLT